VHALVIHAAKKKEKKNSQSTAPLLPLPSHLSPFNKKIMQPEEKEKFVAYFPFHRPLKTVARAY
jgi:hypothetical protein